MAEDDLEYVRLKNGQIGTIPKGPKLQAALAGGATYANSQEIEANRPHSFTENLTDYAEEKGAGFLGVARGASMGQTDELAIALGGEKARQYLERLKNEHPYMSLGGEIEGTIIPGLMTGGAAAAPTAAKAGVLAENLAPKVVEAAPRIAEAAAPVVDAAGEAFGGGRLQSIADTLSTASQGSTPEEIKGAQWLEEMLGKAGKGPATTTGQEAISEAQSAATKIERAKPTLQEALEATNPEGSVKRAREAQEATEALESGTRPGLQAPPEPPGPPARMPGGLENTAPGMGAPPPTSGAYRQEPLLEALEATKPGMRPPAEPVTGTMPGMGPEPVAAPGIPSALPGVGGVTAKMPAIANEVGQVTAKMPSLAETLGKEALASSSVGKAAGVEAGKAASTWADAIPANIVGHAGDEVERGILKLLGPEARSTLGRMLQKGAAGAGRGAVEGGIYGAVDQMNEDRLGGHETNGEKMLAAVGHGMLLGGITGGALSAGGVLTRKVAGEAAVGLRRMAGEQAFRALNPRKAFVDAANDIPGGSGAVGQFLIDLKLVRAGDNLEALEPRITAAKDSAGKFLGTLLDNADAHGIKGPELERIVRGMDEPMARLQKLPSMNQAAITRLEGLQADLQAAARDGRLGFRQAQDLRSRIDDAIKWSTSPLAPVNELTEGLKGARHSIETEIERAMDHVHGGGGAEYKEAKLAYRKLKVASDTAEDALERKLANRGASPSDYMALAVGAMTGHGLLSMAAHHVIKDRGNATAAVLLDKIASYGAVEKAAAQVDRQIARGVGNVFGEGRAAATTREKLMGGDHEARALAVAKAVTGSGDHVAAVQNAISPIATHAPQTAGAFTRASIRVTTYLAHLLPQRDVKPSLTPHLEKVDWSDSEKAKFTRAVDIAHDPVSVLGSLEDGSITPDQVTAIREMYPELYAQMCDDLANKLATQKKALPAGKRMALAQFLGDPALAGPNLEPMFIQAMQANYPTEHGLPVGKQSKGKGHSQKAPKTTDFEFISNEQLTGLDAAEEGDN